MKVFPAFDSLRMQSIAIFMIVLGLLPVLLIPPAAAADPSVEEMVEALSKKAPDMATDKPAGTFLLRGSGPRKNLGTRPTTDTNFSGAGQLRLAVQFDFGSASITAESQALLLKLAAAMKAEALAGLRFRIEGHTDGIGDPQVNMRLSSQRAESVRQFLSRASIDPPRLIAVGKGSSELMDTANPGSAINRRVVVVSLDGFTSQRVEGPRVTSVPQVPVSDDPAPKPVAPPQVASLLTPSPSLGMAQQASADVTTIQPADPLSVGTVLRVLGEPRVIRTNVSTLLTKGFHLREGDKIFTSAATSALVKLADGAQFLVRSNSSVGLTEIVQFGEPSTWKHTIDLAVGAFRYVTGAVGHSRPKSVAFNTPTATIGIRGTDVEVAYTLKTRSLKESGTYVKVNKGEVQLGGLDDSIVTLTINEQAFASAAGSTLRGGTRTPAARKLTSVPNIFTENSLDQIVESE